MKKYGHFTHQLNETVAVNFGFPARGRKGCFWTGCDVNFRWIIRPQKKSQAQSSVLPRPWAHATQSRGVASALMHTHSHVT